MKVERKYFPMGGGADCEASHPICVVAEFAHG